MLQLLQRLDHSGERRTFERRELLDPGTATLKQFPYAGLDVFRTNAREGREGLVAQEGVFHAGLRSGSRQWGLGHCTGPRGIGPSCSAVGARRWCKGPISWVALGLNWGDLGSPNEGWPGLDAVPV